MEKLFTIELTHEEWIEIIVALDSHAHTKKIIEDDIKGYKKIKDIKENIQNQITLKIETEIETEKKSH